jgi:hypothetical protein
MPSGEEQWQLEEGVKSQQRQKIKPNYTGTKHFTYPTH